MTPDEMIESMLGAKFVFSPTGNGLQNHRDWEERLPEVRSEPQQ